MPRLSTALLSRPAGRQAVIVTMVVLIIVMMSVLVGLSPLALGLLAGDEEQWNRLSLIGQTYGAASALLAGLALAGIVFSLVLQVREHKAHREQTLRVIHTDLLKMAMEDPVYRRSWGPFFASDDPDTQREHMYVNLIISNLQMRWEMNAISEHHLRASAGVLLSGEVGRRFWGTGRELRRRAISSRKERRFHDILDDEYMKATTATPGPETPVGAAPTTTDEAVGIERATPWHHRVLSVAILTTTAAAGGALAAMWWARRARSRVTGTPKSRRPTHDA